MSYKTELHCHTSEVSPCSHESAAEVAAKYIENGYDTLVITNHAATDIFNYHIPGESFEEKVKYYFDTVEQVRLAAGDKLHVIDGMEIRFDENNNDYLVFGMTPELLLSYPDVFKNGYRAFHYFAVDNGLVFIQAHPMRFGMTTTTPDWVDGYEIFNGHPNQRSHNDVAEAWARHFTRHKLILTSGTDNHDAYMTPDGGIETDAPITTPEELIAILRGGNYTLIRSPLGDAEY